MHKLEHQSFYDIFSGQPNKRDRTLHGCSRKLNTYVQVLIIVEVRMLTKCCKFTYCYMGGLPHSANQTVGDLRNRSYMHFQMILSDIINWKIVVELNTHSLLFTPHTLDLLISRDI